MTSAELSQGALMHASARTTVTAATSRLRAAAAGAQTLPPQERRERFSALLGGDLHDALLHARADADDDILPELGTFAALVADLVPVGVEDALEPRAQILFRLLRRGDLQPAWTLAHDNASGRITPRRARSTWAGGTYLRTGLPLPTVVESGSVYAWLPGFRDPRYGVPDSVYLLDRQVRLCHSLDDVRADRGVLLLAGSAYLTVLDTGPDDVLRLVFDGPDGQQKRLRAERARRPDLTSARGPELTRLAWAGWYARLPLQSAASLHGEWSVSLELTHRGVVRTEPIGPVLGPLAESQIVEERINDERPLRAAGIRLRMTPPSASDERGTLTVAAQRVMPIRRRLRRALAGPPGSVIPRRTRRPRPFANDVTDGPPEAIVAPGPTASRAPVKVSVVVPVWNPGPSLIRCIDSLTDQTMPTSDYEILCVDDGSSDGAADRLDRLAECHPQLRVIHTPNSGWPGAPRNIGLDAARGEFVHFVDNDDVVPHYALRDLYDAAIRDDADVVCGRPVSNFRRLNHSIYRRDLRSVSLADHPELMGTLTPHRMFRRSLLVNGDRLGPIRYPEGPVPLEDQFFVLRAYAAATGVTLLADRPYYYYLRRAGSGRNAGDRPVDVEPLMASVEQLLDVVDAVVTSAHGAGDGGGECRPTVRDEFYRRTLRLVVLPRITSTALMEADRSWYRAMHDAVRRLLTTRLAVDDGQVIAGLGAAQRAIARMAATPDADTEQAARSLARVSMTAVADDMRWSAMGGGCALSMRIRGHLTWRGQPLRLVDVGGGDVGLPVAPHFALTGRAQARWALPLSLLEAPASDRLVGIGVEPVDVAVILSHRATGMCYEVRDGLRVWVEDSGGGVGELRVDGEIVIDPDSAGGTANRPAGLDDGLWDVTVQLRWEGISRRCAVRVDENDLAAPLLSHVGSVWPHRTNRTGALGLDIGSWTRSIAALAAPTAQVRLGAGARRLAVDLAVATACARRNDRAENAGEPPMAALPGACGAAELILVPDRATAGGIVRVRGALEQPTADPATGPFGWAAATFELPPAMTDGGYHPDGAWQVWLHLSADLGPAAPAVPLAWTLRRERGRLAAARTQAAPEPSR